MNCELCDKRRGDTPFCLEHLEEYYLWEVYLDARELGTWSRRWAVISALYEAGLSKELIDSVFPYYHWHSIKSQMTRRGATRPNVYLSVEDRIARYYQKTSHLRTL